MIRELKQDENKVLDTFLYEAIFIPEGVSAPPKDIINPVSYTHLDVYKRQVQIGKSEFLEQNIL